MSENPYEAPVDGVQVGRRRMRLFLRTVLQFTAIGCGLGLMFMVPSMAGSDFEPQVVINGKQESPWFIIPFLGMMFMVMGILFATARSVVAFFVLMFRRDG